MATPTPEETVRRACELHALGASQPEAARAVGIGLRTFEKHLALPEYRALVERKRGEQSNLLRGAVDVLEAGLEAEHHDGAPNHLVRTKASEAVLKNIDAIRKIQGGVAEYEDLEGTITVFPRRDGSPVRAKK